MAPQPSAAKTTKSTDIMPNFARVAINIAQIEELFDYAIPAELQPMRVGTLVVVPFGKQNVQGIVVDLIEEPAVPEYKVIESRVDSEPVVTTSQLELARWMAEENLSTLSECLEQMLPPGLSQHADVLVHLNPSPENKDDLPLMQKRIIGALEKRGDLRGRQIDALFPKIEWRNSLQALVRNGLVTSRPILTAPSIHPRTIRNISLAVPAAEALQQIAGSSRMQPTTVERRRSILQLLERESGPVDISIVYAETGANAEDIKYLSSQELISVGESEVWRDPLAKLPPTLFNAPVLNPGQAAAWKMLEAQINGGTRKKTNLLIGVTGSGKTELYLRAVAATLAKNRSALILVPEIALTPQTVRRFYARFPGKVGLVHSKLSPGERYDTWRRIRSGALPVVVGPRSALFSPFPDLGLIVIDECHEESYYQDDFRPHYSAVETALAYAQQNDAVIVLGSATPSVEQLYRSRREKWNELNLPDRILAHEDQAGSPETMPGVLPLPQVQIIDMREELKAGNRSVLSRELHRSIDETLAREEQAILFLNRRGSASYVFCRDCGHVMRCPRCDTQLTFHEHENALICHLCNYRRNMPAVCPNCKGKHIRQYGLGTESLEKTVSEQFPNARVLRWDADTARFKGAHDLILDHFSQHRADILIGTKMLAKGLDLPLVTLVGAVLADVSMNLPDFRAGERTFELLSQVAGRAGRSGRGGRAIFQTFTPEAWAIQTAALHDLEGFYAREIEMRRKTGYPPFSRLIRIEFRHYKEDLTREAAELAGEQIATWVANAGDPSIQMIGPVPCFYGRTAGQYRWQILLKGNDPRKILAEHPLRTWQMKDVSVEIMVDPPDVL
jgi:primosomal protein N' (replication factor Y)